MKAIRLITLLITLTPLFAQEQSFGFRAQVQETVMGLQTGYGIVADGNKVGLGIIYQENRTVKNIETQKKYQFYGAEFRYKIGQCGNIKMIIAPKIGMVDNKFLTVIPEVLTEFQVTRFGAAFFGAGIRARQAAISAGIIFKPFTK